MNHNASGYADPTAGAAIAHADKDAERERIALENGKIKIVLRIPPSVNHMYITTRSGKRAPSTHTNAWMTEAKIIIRSAMRRHKPCPWRMIQGRKVIMEITAYWAAANGRDMNNIHKLLCDAPEGELYENDSQVLVRDMDYSVVGKRAARVEIVVYDRELEEQP